MHSHFCPNVWKERQLLMEIDALRIDTGVTKNFFLELEIFLNFLLTHKIFDTCWKFEQNLSKGLKNIRFLIKLWFSHTVYPKMHILPINKKPNVWHKNYLTSNYLQDILHIQLECWLQEISKNFVKIYRNWLFFLKNIHILLAFLCSDIFGIVFRWFAFLDDVFHLVCRRKCQYMAHIFPYG